jgi:hypothetical protein
VNRFCSACVNYQSPVKYFRSNNVDSTPALCSFSTYVLELSL